MAKLKKVLNATVDRLARVSGLRHTALRFRRGHVPIFLLHRMANRDWGIRGHEEAQLADLLDSLSELGARILSVRQVVDLVTAGEQPPDGAVAFSADDGYSDQAERLAPIFVERQMPLTIFAISGFLDGAIWPWDAKIAYAIHSTKLTRLRLKIQRLDLELDLSSPRERLLARRECQALAKTLPADTLDEFIRHICEVARVECPSSAPAAYGAMTWDQARELEQKGITFAPHTVTHRILSRLSDGEVREELDRSWRRLAEELRRPEKLIAWPVGRPFDYGVRERKIARELGFSAAFAASDRYVVADPAARKWDLDRFGFDFEDGGQSARRIFLGLQLRQRIDPNAVGRESLDSESKQHWPISRRMWGPKTYLGMIGTTASNLVLRRYRRLDAQSLVGINRLVFVCLGNICRSPYAEARALANGIPAVSCGVDANGVAAADPTAARVAALRGLDLCGHRSQSVSSITMNGDDLVLVMEPRHIDQVRPLAERVGARVALLGLWSRPSRPLIPDPFGRGAGACDQAFGMIDQAIGRLVHELPCDELPAPAAASTR